MTQPIVIVGVKHTGKSVAASALAECFQRTVIDTDLVLQELDAAESGMRRPVRQIYRQDGVSRFHQLEATALELALRREDAPVVSTGGGICDNQRAVDLLRDQFVVHLTDSYDRVAQRVFRSGIPAFLTATTVEKAREELFDVYTRRTVRYREIASITIDIEELDAQAAGERICSALEEYISGRQ